ncbi:MAG TPA: tetratricopeptide repeat protein [Pyrinomonadaceae bacterium]|nr:tetratricopeptide repeat protein [Pyrinomonadaceae bacterium]
MSHSQQAAAGEPAAADGTVTEAVDQELQLLLQAIRSDDGEGIAAAIDRLGEKFGTAAASPINAALAACELKDKMLDTLTSRAKTTASAPASLQLAAAAAIVGRDDLAVEAADKALQIEPINANAAVVLVGAANRRGDYEEALRVIADLVAQVPAAGDEPIFIIQSAMAEIGRNQPKTALSGLEAGLPRLTAAGLEFDAQVVRARALCALTGRGDEVVSAWERAVVVARHPAQVEGARYELIAALWETGRYDECLREIDLALAATADRAGGLKMRVNVLVKKGDIDGALAVMDDLLASAAPGERMDFCLQQAGICAMAGRWKDAAAHFDAAIAEVPKAAADANDRRHAIQMQKAQTLASHEIDLVISDLDQLDAAWTAGGWPVPLEVRVVGLMSAGRNADALAWLNQRLARSSTLAEHPAGHHLRAEILLKLGEIEEAMSEYERAVNAASTFTDPRAWGSALYCALTSQQWNGAVTAYQKLKELHPASVDSTVCVMAAQAYVRLGDPQKALDLTDGDPPILPNILMMRDLCRAEAQIRLGLYDEALATTAEALERFNSVRAEPTPFPTELVLSLHTFRAQAFNQTGQFEEARKAASAAIDIVDQPGSPVPGLTALVRLGLYMQRSVALFQLGETAAAQCDINEAIDGFERLRHSSVMTLMEGSQFEEFEGALWYSKGLVLDAENRNEEALAAYTRAEKLEKQGSAAAIARGYALSSTGAFTEATFAFDVALTRAASPLERADAFAGKGRALVRLKKYEKAIAALQAALDARLTTLDDNPIVFEQLGLAYSALQRDGAAKRAFYRAWELSKPGKQQVNLARGITAADLRLGEPEKALAFIEGLTGEIPNDRALLFNRALALDALGRRPEAIPFMVRAKDAGLERAQRELDRLDVPTGLSRWTHYWFGPQASQKRRAFGITLAIIAATLLGAPLYQWGLSGKPEWYLVLVPSVVALLVLALPNMKSLGFEGGGLSVSVEPLSATGRDAAEVAAPESSVVREVEGRIRLAAISSTLRALPILKDAVQVAPQLSVFVMRKESTLP